MEACQEVLRLRPSIEGPSYSNKGMSQIDGHLLVARVEQRKAKTVSCLDLAKATSAFPSCLETQVS